MSRRTLTTLAVACGLALSALPAVAVGPAAAAVPSSYTETLVGDVPSPTALSKTATGELLVTSQAGSLYSFTATGQRRTLLTFLDICATSERGLLGVTNDVGSATGSYVYVYATRSVGPGGSCVNRVSRFAWNDTTISAATETVLLDNIPSPGSNHNGGDIQFGKDGNLYIGIGDGGCHPNGSGCGASNSVARDLGSMLGKIARITRTGGIPAGNPYTGAGTTSCRTTGGTVGGPKCQEVYGSGLRNPFRLGFDLNAAGTSFYINDVGQNTWEEISAGIAGADYGWNTREGGCATGSTTNCGTVAGLTNPVYAYPHSAGCDTLTGGAFAPPGWNEPTGTYFYAEYSCGTIVRLTPNGSTFTASTFADDVGTIVDLKSFDDGSMYYSTYANGGRVFRITRSGTFTPPGPARFVPLAPTRIMDTRGGLGFSGGRVTGGTTVALKVTGGSVPAQATSVATNVTVTGSSNAGFLTIWPTSTAKPTTSSINYGSGETVANASIIATGPSGSINISASSTTHVIVDITGYWLPASASTSGRFVSLTEPTRVVDTRSGLGTGVAVAKVPANGTIDLTLAGKGGLPASGMSAIVATITAVNAGAAGFVTAWPTGVPLPNASALNPTAPGDVRANLVIMPLGTGGKMSVFSSISTDIIVDVVGYMTDSTAANQSVGLFQLVAPERVNDTRLTGVRQAANTTASYGMNGKAAGTATALVYNLTAASTLGSGFLTAFPHDRPAVPLASNVNASAASQDRAALVVTRGTGVSGGSSGPFVKVFSFMPTHVIVDLTGYFLAGST